MCVNIRLAYRIHIRQVCETPIVGVVRLIVEAVGVVFITIPCDVMMEVEDQKKTEEDVRKKEVHN